MGWRGRDVWGGEVGCTGWEVDVYGVGGRGMGWRGSGVWGGEVGMYGVGR